MKNFNNELLKNVNIMFTNGWDISRIAEKLGKLPEDIKIYQAKRLIDKGLCAQEVERLTGVNVLFDLISKEQSPRNPWEYEYWYKIRYSYKERKYEEDWFITQ